MASTRHLSDASVRRLVTEPAAAGIWATRHVASCRRCTERVAVWRGLADVTAPAAAAGCPSEQELVHLAIDALDEAERHAVERHVDGCPVCAVLVEDLLEGRDHLPFRRRQGEPAAAATTVASAATTVTDAAAALAERLRALLSFEMPLRVALTTRGEPAAAAGGEDGEGSRFARALALYEAGRFDEALPALERADAAGESQPALAFFLGVCRLRAGDAAAAAEALAAAVANEPDIGEYRWYLAQARLLGGDGEAALAELERASRQPGPYRDEARALARQVRTALKEAPA